jgi:hypothetical protein
MGSKLGILVCLYRIRVNILVYGICVTQSQVLGIGADAHAIVEASFMFDVPGGACSVFALPYMYRQHSIPKSSLVCFSDLSKCGSVSCFR